MSGNNNKLQEVWIIKKDMQHCTKFPDQNWEFGTKTHRSTSSMWVGEGDYIVAAL
jgi:hypothetical protein